MNRKIQTAAFASVLVCCFSQATAQDSAIDPTPLQPSDFMASPGTGYPGTLSLPELMEAMLGDVDLDQADVRVEFGFTLVKDGNRITGPGSLDGLPVEQSLQSVESGFGQSARDSARIDEISMTVPFNVSRDLENYPGGLHEYGRMMENMLSQLVVSDASSADDKNRDQPEGLHSPVLNQPNCGGFSVGSTITTTIDPGCLGIVSNTYQCMTVSIGGEMRNDWINTDSNWMPPADVIGICP